MTYVLDIHKDSVLVYRAGEDGKEECLRLKANREVMKEFLEGLPEDSTVVMESCYAWEYIYDMAVENGLNAVVADTGALYTSGKPQKKNDLEDCRRLARLYKIGELPTIFVFDERTRKLRDLLRARRFTTEKITAYRNHTHFVTDRLGLRFPSAELFGAHPANPAELSIDHNSQVQLASIQRILATLEDEEKRLDGEIIRQLVPTEQIKLILTIPGVGMIIAAGIYLEIGTISRFARKENLTAYAGVVPQLDESGGTTKDRRLRTRCNRNLRWAAVEAARHAIQCDKDLREYYLRRIHVPEAQATRPQKSKAVVATARHLLEVIWCMLSRGEAYRGSQGIPTKKMQKIRRMEKPYPVPAISEIADGVASTLERPANLRWSPEGEWEGGWEKNIVDQAIEEVECRTQSKTAITPASIFL